MTADLDLIRRAANQMRADDDERWHPVADWIDWTVSAIKRAFAPDAFMQLDTDCQRALAVARAFLKKDADTTHESPDAWVDRHGDVWRERPDGLMETPETQPFSREHVEKKWGPLRPAREVI